MVFEADSITAQPVWKTLLVNAGTHFPKLSAVAIFSFIFPHIRYTKLPASYAVSNSPAVQMMVIIQRNATTNLEKMYTSPYRSFNFQQLFFYDIFLLNAYFTSYRSSAIRESTDFLLIFLHNKKNKKNKNLLNKYKIN